MRNLALLLAVLMVVMAVSPAMAGPISKAQDLLEKTLDKYPAKVGTYYSLDGDEWDLISGVVIKENVKGKPIDIAVYTDGDTAVLLGADINVKLTKNSRIGIGLVVGVDRIEDPRNLGEFKFGPSIIAKIKF